LGDKNESLNYTPSSRSSEGCFRDYIISGTETAACEAGAKLTTVHLPLNLLLHYFVKVEFSIVGLYFR